MMKLRFWGVRGSIASAGREHAQVGGNTSCVELRCTGDDGQETLIVCDAGTGLRALGNELRGRVDAHILLSHFHWDHIQGFPFFTPAYVPGNRVQLYAPAASGAEVRAALAAQMRAPHFPVGLDALGAELGFVGVAAGSELALGDASRGVRVRASAGHHPGGVLAWRVDCAGASVVYATDTEHADDGALDESLLELARDADVLIYDAQYTSAEYPAKRGWGHSTPEEGARLARAAGVGQLLLFHHDPGHDDWQIARMEAATRALFPSTLAAREGLTLSLAPRARQAVA